MVDAVVKGVKSMDRLSRVHIPAAQHALMKMLIEIGFVVWSLG